MNNHRNIAFIYILLFISMMSYGQKRNSTELNLEENSNLNIKLIGNIKYVREIKENIESDDKEEIEYFFDNKGLPTKIIKKSLGLDIINRVYRDEVTVFNFTNGFLVSELKEIESKLDGYIYELDDKNNTTLKKFYIQNCLVSEETYEYDLSNRLTKSIDYVYGYSKSSDNERVSQKPKYISMIETIKYDDLGQVIETTMNNIRGKVFKKKVYIYDSKGNKIEEGRCNNYSGINSKDLCDYSPLYGWDYNDKNQIIREFQLAKFSPHNTDSYYKYDYKGNEIEAKGYYIKNDTVLGYHYKYEYDNYGNKTEEKEVVGNYKRLGFESYKTFIIEFDEFQSVTLKKYIKDDGSTIKVIRINYVYDENNNWVERETEEGKNINEMTKKEIVKRIIEYY